MKLQWPWVSWKRYERTRLCMQYWKSEALDAQHTIRDQRAITRDLCDKLDAEIVRLQAVLQHYQPKPKRDAKGRFNRVKP